MMRPKVERRHAARIRLQVPIFLRGVDTAGREFLELTKTVDISSTGACVASRRLLKLETMIRLTVPVSSEPASGHIPSETPPIQARIRRLSGGGEAWLVAVEFLRPLE